MLLHLRNKKTKKYKFVKLYKNTAWIIALLHSSDEPSEPSKWLCHDDITINIVLSIIPRSISISINIINITRPCNVPRHVTARYKLSFHYYYYYYYY